MPAERARLVLSGESTRIPAMPDPAPRYVLFVCMGNICRSPLAEGLFLHKINKRGVAHLFAVDSCGIGDWHIGIRPDHRALDVARQNGITLPSRARQIHRKDFDRFDVIVCMDEENRNHLLALGAPKDKVRLLLEFDPDATMLEVPDPYYGDPEDFELTFQLIDSATDVLLETMLREMS